MYQIELETTSQDIFTTRKITIGRVYFYQQKTEEAFETKRMMLTKQLNGYRTNMFYTQNKFI